MGGKLTRNRTYETTGVTASWWEGRRVTRCSSVVVGQATRKWASGLVLYRGRDSFYHHADIQSTVMEFYS